MDNSLLEKYIHAHTEYNKLYETIKQLKKTKEELGQVIIQYCINNNIETMTHNGQKITMKKNIQKESINKDYLSAALNDFVNKERKLSSHFADDAAEYLLENRNKKEKFTLKVH